MEKIAISLFAILTFASFKQNSQRTIVGEWKTKDIHTNEKDNNTNFAAAALLTLDAVPAKVNISANQIEFLDKNGQKIGSAKYWTEDNDKIFVVEGSDTSKGTFTLKDNSELKISFDSAEYIFLK